MYGFKPVLASTHLLIFEVLQPRTSAVQIEELGSTGFWSESEPGLGEKAFGILAAMSVILDDLDADWPRVRALAEQLAGSTGDNADSVFFPLGLRLHGRHGGQSDYGATPANSTTFASTGGDGVHFSLLHTPTAVPGTAPVVMTVPMQFHTPNHLVGASLREFLALGCRSGYYHLERLAYDWGRQQETSHLEHGEWAGAGWDGESEETTVLALLAALTKEFSLAPWPDVAQHLATLQASYLPAVRPQQ